MSKYKKLSHAIYYCTYHIVWVPKHRYRVPSGAIKEMMERDIRGLLRIEVPFKDPMEDAVKVAIKAGSAEIKTKKIEA